MARIRLFLVIAVAVSGCGYLNLRESPFDNPTCPAPCWRGIRPGETSLNETLAILSKMRDIPSPPFSPEAPPFPQFDNELMFSIFNSTGPNVYMYFHADKIEVIGFELHLNLTVGEAIRAFGNPESILVLNTGAFYKVVLLNPQTGWAVGYDYNGLIPFAQSQISPRTSLTSAIMFDPDALQRLIDSGILSSYSLTGEETGTALRPWAGYGIIGEKYWPPAESGN